MHRRTFVESLGLATIPSNRLLQALTAVSLPPLLKDYGCSPGSSDFDEFGRLNLGKRPNTCLVILPDNEPVVSAFIDFLKNPSPVDPGQCGPDKPRPTNDKRQLLVVSHATSRGTLVIGLDPTHYSVKSPLTGTEYEDVERAFSTHTIEIPPLLVIDGTPVTSSSTVFRIMGCRIGTSKPVLE